MPHVPLSSLGPGTFAPAYLGSADLPWLRILLDEADRFRGRPRAELQTRLGEPLPFEVAPWKVRLCGRVLLAMEDPPPRPKVSSRAVRRAVFGEAARGGGRDEILERAAAALGLPPGAIDEALYADLPSRRPVPALGAELGPVELAQRANLALVQALVARTRSMTIRATGGARDLVRHAKREGLLCTVLPGAEPDAYRLDVSGPLALFKKTAVYAHALAGLVPRLSWCRRYVLEAACETARGPLRVLVRSGDPLSPCREPVRFDSALEERFARDFARAAPGWDVIREPEPVPVDGTLVFPDFALVSRVDPAERWMVEIVGFWTPGYLAQKLERLRALDAPRLIVCVDEARACAAEGLPPGARVVPFRRHVDPDAVLAAMGIGQS